MVRHIDAIFSQGAFRPTEPVILPEGTRVHLSIEEEAGERPGHVVAKIHSPRLAHPEDAAHFVMAVGETGNAGV